VRDVTTEVLRAAGYVVLSVCNADEAFGVYSHQRGEIDLLLTDVILPGESGRSLAEKLLRKNPHLVVLFVTGYADQMDIHGNGHCLAKPFSTRVLLREIRELLDPRYERRKKA
jgi:two-component system, cell cycle sensor histidine kinase and response regulator CckA